MCKCQSLQVPPRQLWKHGIWVLHGRVTFVKSVRRMCCGYTADRTATVSPTPKSLGRSTFSNHLANAPSSVASQHNTVTKRSGTCPAPGAAGALHRRTCGAPCQAAIAPLRSGPFPLPPSAQTGGEVSPRVLGLIGLVRVMSGREGDLSLQCFKCCRLFTVLPEDVLPVARVESGDTL